MEPKLNETKKELDPLPDDGTTQKFVLGEDKVCKRGDHAFKYVTATEVECIKCPVGYRLPVEAVLKNDHIYIDNQLLV